MFSNTLLKPSNESLEEMRLATASIQTQNQTIQSPALQEALQRKIVLDDMKKRYLPFKGYMLMLFIAFSLLTMSICYCFFI